MVKVECQVKPFRELTLDHLFELLRLRVDVFVVEQHCAYPELDDFDRHIETRHLCGRQGDGPLIAYVRILGPGVRYSEVSFGRFVVKQDWRGQGIGHQLIRAALQQSSAHWPKIGIRISAQDYLQRFYEQYGFSRVSDIYLEDGVPHVEMVKEG